MNILLLALDVNLADQRGDSIHTRELTRFLGARGNHVTIVTATPPGSVPEMGKAVVHEMRPDAGDFTITRFCARLATRVRAEAIYERRLSPKISYAVSRLAGLPFAVEVNGIEEEADMLGRPDRSPWRPIKRRIRAGMFRKANQVVAVTEGLAHTVHYRYGVTQERLVVVPNGVDPERFAPRDESEACRSLGWAAAPWVLFIGNLVPWQGVETLVRSAPKILSERSNARIAIVGEGLLHQSLERLCHDLGVADHTLFVGAVPYERVPTYLAAARVCVAPLTRARNEAIGVSPLKVYEYLACGRPVVASDVPGVSELLLRSKGGILVPPGDSDALGAAISQLIGNPTDANRMGSLGREFAVAECSWTRAAERVERVLRFAADEQ